MVERFSEKNQAFISLGEFYIRKREYKEEDKEVVINYVRNRKKFG